MNKILLVGGEGYIGSVLCRRLLDSGYKVTSMDNFTYGNRTIPLSNIFHQNYKFVNEDMRSHTELENLFKSNDIVVLLAGLVGDPITKLYPKDSKLINDIGVKNIIDLSNQHSVKKFIFISTCSNYGLIKDNEKADENFELKPLSLYANSKVNAENYILSLKDNTDMTATILRFATAFGLSPRMRFDLTISQFARELYFGNELEVFDEKTWRPYCHIIDFARLIIKVIESPEEKVNFEVFNAGSNENNATKKMIVEKILNKIPNGIIKYKEHGSDPRNYRVNFEKVQSTLGFEASKSIDDGIEELIDAFENKIFISNNDIYGNYTIES